MITLLTLDDQLELCMSHDPDVIIDERDPVRAIPKKDVQINGGQPLVITVRPLNSRETLRIFSTNDVSTAEPVIQAAEVGIVAIRGDGINETSPKKVQQLISRLPPDVLGAVGNWVLSASLSVPDPLENDG